LLAKSINRFVRGNRFESPVQSTIKPDSRDASDNRMLF